MIPLDEKTKKTGRRMSYIVLCAAVALVTVLFGVRVSYPLGVYYALVIVQLTVICLPGWKLGAWAVRAESEERRRLATAGSLLVIPWGLFSFLTGFSAPQLATNPENQLRYLILMINTLAVAGGLIVLWHTLSVARERFYSTLGFASIVLAGPLYFIFTAVQLVLYRTMDRTGVGEATNILRSLDELAVIFLYFGVVLTYLATALFAAAIGRLQWLGRTARRVFVGLSLFAIMCVLIKMAEIFSSPHNPMWGFETWYMIPGFVFSIPAVPWMMPCLVGIVLLHRAGEA
ncbi:MAG: hypothetical protein HY708_03890 [Ignavibacteriae bacterium]|nr:hypothetical protein [Ignavibacteriota bacterium]